MRYIVFYIPETDPLYPGRINSIVEYPDGTADATITADQPAGCIWLEGDADPTKDYILAGVVTERPDFGAAREYRIDADGLENTLFTMPDGTLVTHKGDVHVAGAAYVSVDGEDDGDILGAGDDELTFSMGDTDFVFASDRTGEFEFKVEPEFPYLPTVVTVKANAV
jgi:hypothetical protein